MKRLIFLIAFLISSITFGQIVKMQVDGTKSITTTQRDALTVPSGEFWKIYNITTDRWEYWNGLAWSSLIPPAGAELNNLSTAVTWINVPDANITAPSVTQHITLTGDVTSTGLATTISAGAVDIAMLSATGTPNGTTFLRGDNTWSAGAAGDMVLASAQTNTGIKTFLNTTFKLRNFANTFDGYFFNTNTADRIYTLQDASGTLAFTSQLFTPSNLLTDYSFTDNSTNWNTAFGWGNHAVAGYSTGAHTVDTNLSIATSAEVNTGTDNTKAISPLALAGSALQVKVDAIEAFADVTDATNVNAAGAVMEADYDANTILAATTDNTPVALTVNAQTLVGRITSGNTASLTQSQVHTLLADRILENATVTTTQTLDYGAYEIFNFTVTGNVTFSETNLPTSGSYGKVILINSTGNFAITYPAGWSTSITGAYDGTVNNIIAVWYIKSGTYKVQITQPD